MPYSAVQAQIYGFGITAYRPRAGDTRLSKIPCLEVAPEICSLGHRRLQKAGYTWELLLSKILSLRAQNLGPFLELLEPAKERIL